MYDLPDQGLEAGLLDRVSFRHIAWLELVGLTPDESEPEANWAWKPMASRWRNP